MNVSSRGDPAEYLSLAEVLAARKSYMIMLNIECCSTMAQKRVLQDCPTAAADPVGIFFCKVSS